MNITTATTAACEKFALIVTDVTTWSCKYSFLMTQLWSLFT